MLNATFAQKTFIEGDKMCKFRRKHMVAYRF